MRSRYDSPTIGQWAEQIECAKRLGANIVTDLQTMGVPDNSELNGAGFAAEIVRLAQEHEVTLCLETGRLATLLEVGKRFESIRYCLDTGGGRADDECSFRQCVDELGPKIAHVHLSDIYGPPRNSLPPRTRTSAGTFGFPGDGSAYQGLCRFWCGGGRPREDWDYLLAALNEYDNDVIGSIEVSPCMPSVMIRQASEFLFDRLEWPNRPERPGLAKDPVGGEPLGRAGVEQ
jgi:sugar phosphate isomerase/epimerase